MTDAEVRDAAWKRGMLAIALLASIAACVHGVVHEGLATGLWENPRGSLAGALVLAVVLAGTMAIARHRGLGFGTALAVPFLAVALAFAGIGPVAAVALLALSAFCLGSRFAGAGGIAADGRVGAIIAIAAGMAVLSFVVSALTFLPVNNPATYLALLALPVAFGWRRNREWLCSLPPLRNARPPDASRWVAWLDFATAFALALRLLAALNPEIGNDALAMHLVIAERLADEGRFNYDVTRSIWAVMPMAADWQLAIAHMLGGEPAARLLNFLADALLVLLVRNVAAAARGAFAGAVAGAVYATTPLLFLETASLFIENVWTLWCCAALVAAWRAVDRPTPRAAVIAGLLVGTALAAKVMTAFLAPFFLAAAFAWIAKGRSNGLRMLAAFVIAALVASALPYANAWIRTGNPVFPFMNEIFRSPYFDASASFDNTLFDSHASWRTLYDVTFRSGKFLEAVPGAIGVSWLVLLPASLLAALAGRGAPRVAAVCAVAFVVLVFAFQSYLRYILPALPVLAFLAGIAAAGATAGSPRARGAVAMLVLACAAAGLYLTPASNFIHRSIDLPPFAGSEAAEDLRAKLRPDQRMARVIDALPLHKVLWIGTAYMAGAGTDVRVANWQGGWQLHTAFGALGSEEALRAWLAANQFDAVAIAADAHACDRPFICAFLDAHARRVYSDGATGLYLLDPDVLHTEELLRNGGFDGGTAGWDGAGEFRSGDGDGAVVVSAATPFTQAVPVTPGTRYALEVRGRCSSDRADYRAQVNWLDGKGAFIDTSLVALACGPSYEAHSEVVQAPAGATTAVVYASGHLADKTAEITAVSFRK
jgi:hypothetical protein